MAASRWLRVLSCGALFGALALSIVGCKSSISPGDYKIYRVAIDKSGSKSSGCYPDGKVPAAEKASSDDAKTSSTWEIYAGSTDQEQYFLEMDGGKETFEGSKSDKTYTFETTKVVVAYANPDGTGFKYTKTDRTTIDVTMDGKTITGSVTTTHSEKCSGDKCPTVPATCSQTLEYTGTEVDDVELKHDV
jgi:predicted GNAT family acetyltransferase